ncbi:long-chain fatty acid--CoA ligase [Cellulomonas sp. PhB143]|uniref:long-chain-fatty-acid--CoA ligase n=1 Tax=Cellulomonas sp. PhB143 TaxID=2485186 RepID=UPI000F47F45B|nr:long-chain fatty acid--CoA ligase [Cellulomonas sp. PhB143]ROS78429.1 long-chain acyl-CoA synthetase [Cellulomonas sp. PhB143]
MTRHAPDPAIDGDGFGTLSAATILSGTAARHPARTAILYGDETITYADLWAQALAYAGALRARGVGRGDRVAVLVPNVPDFPRVYYAVLALGAVVVPVHLLFKADEIEHVLRDCGIDLMVAAGPVLGEALPAARGAGVPVVTVLAPAAADGGPDLPRLEDEASSAAPLPRAEAVRPTDAATILYTSGTTGTPKGAVASHLTVVEQVHAALLDSIEILPDDVIFGGLPLFHGFGQSAVMNLGFRRGAAIVLLPRFEPRAALDLLVEHRATVFTAVPTMYVGMIEAARGTDARPPLRFAISGGAALPVAVLEAFSETFGASVHEGYGLTEAGPNVSVNTVFEPIRPGTVGRPLWGVDVAVADPAVEGRVELLEEPGAVGEVVVRGHNLFKGYLGREDASREAVVDGWLRSGDLGTVDADGILTIVDRKKDMIVRNGYNVYPLEVEAVLARHPDVAIAAVFGVPDERHGQEVHAAVVLGDDASVAPEDLAAFAREKIAAYKYPRVVHVVDAMPLGPSGKVLKRVLAERFAPA